MKTNILYEDSDLFVCRKPAGLAVQSGRAFEPDMVSELKNYLAQKGGPSPYLGVIHRLDRPVSGLLVFAKNKKAAADLSAQSRSRQMEKTYRAIVVSEDPDLPKAAAKEETLTDYIKKDVDNTARIARPEEPGAKLAQLSSRCLQRKGNLALLEISLKTGRYHQIRLQLSHAGMPILGDTRYGAFDSPCSAGAICLEAVKLSFLHPRTRKRICYELDEKMELPKTI